MKQFFIGFLLVLLDFNIDFNGGVVNFLPDFAGYYFILKGLRLMKEESGSFDRAAPVAKGMIGYTLLLWIVNFIGLLMQGGTVLSVFELLGGIGFLYVSYWVIAGIREMEARYQADMGGKTLSVLWKILIVLEIGMPLLMIMMPLFFLFRLLKVFVIALLVLTFSFLVKFYEAWRAWDTLQQTRAAEQPPAVQLAKPEPGQENGPESTEE